MKLYEKMRPDENMSWCKCFMSDDGQRAITVNEGEINGEYGLVNVLCCDLESLIENEELREVGCADCPFRDECELMDENEESEEEA